MILLLISLQMFTPFFMAEDENVFIIEIYDEESLKKVLNIIPGARLYGNGTPSDPYVLENITIYVSGLQGILIEHFNKPLVLRDVRIYGTSIKPDIETNALKGGIAIYISSHISLENITLFGNWLGLYVLNSKDICIRNSKIISNNIGVRIKDSENVGVLNTAFINNYKSIELSEAQDIVIKSCTFTNTFQYGIDVSMSNDVKIIENTLIYNNIAIEIERSYEISISRNLLIENENGIILYKKVMRSNITNNYFYKNYAYAVSILLSCSNIMVYLNSFFYNAETKDIFVNKSQAQDLDGVALWNTSEYGNYWHDLAGISEDADNDCILETAYPISGLTTSTFDWRPLAYPPLQINVTKVKERVMEEYLSFIMKGEAFNPTTGYENNETSVMNIISPKDLRKIIEESQRIKNILEISAGIAMGGSIVFLIISFLMRREFIKK